MTSQQDSSVLQVISGPETSVQEEMSLDAMHVFIDEHGKSLFYRARGRTAMAVPGLCLVLGQVLDIVPGRQSWDCFVECPRGFSPSRLACSMLTAQKACYSPCVSDLQGELFGQTLDLTGCL